MGVDFSHGACPAWLAARVLQGTCHVRDAGRCAASRAAARLHASGLMPLGVRIWCTWLRRASFRCAPRRDEAWRSASGLWRCTCAAALCMRCVVPTLKDRLLAFAWDGTKRW